MFNWDLLKKFFPHSLHNSTFSRFSWCIVRMWDLRASFLVAVKLQSGALQGNWLRRCLGIWRWMWRVILNHNYNKILLSVKIVYLLGFKITRIIAKITLESLDLEMNHFLVFWKVFNKDSTSWTLLPQLSFQISLSSFRLWCRAFVNLLTMFFQSTWLCCSVRAFITKILFSWDCSRMRFIDVLLDIIRFIELKAMWTLDSEKNNFKWSVSRAFFIA